MTPRAALLEAIATELDRVMVAHGLTQEDVASRAAAHVNTVSRILRARNARLSTVAEVFAALGYRLRLEVDAHTTSCGSPLR